MHTLGGAKIHEKLIFVKRNVMTFYCMLRMLHRFCAHRFHLLTLSSVEENKVKNVIILSIIKFRNHNHSCTGLIWRRFVKFVFVSILETSTGNVVHVPFEIRDIFLQREHAFKSALQFTTIFYKGVTISKSFFNFITFLRW